MLQLLISAFVLSIVHASIPNHWLPFVAIGKTERWDRSLTLRATAISGFAHIASTILIGLLVGWAGFQFASNYHSLYTIIATSVLVGLGIIYMVMHFVNAHKKHHHEHPEKEINKTSVRAIIISLSVSMFFSPCIELETYYFKAGEFGWTGIFSVSLIYLVVTVSMMLVLVHLALKGLSKFKFYALQQNEKLIIGILLICTGTIMFFIS